MKIYNGKKYFIFLIIFASVSAQSIDLQTYLKTVKEKHPVFESLHLSTQAAEDRRSVGDLSLSPVFNARVSRVDDKAPTAIPAQMGDRTIVSDYSFGFNKRFSTGTSLGVKYDQQKDDIRGILIPTATTGVYAAFPAQYTGSIALTASQSLWKDAFGKGTSLRRERESLTERIEKVSQTLQALQTLQAAEMAFWDLRYQQEDLKIRQESLSRAEVILNWNKKRYADGIANISDYLQAQGLYLSRQLSLNNSQDDLKAAKQKVVDYLNKGEGDSSYKGEVLSEGDYSTPRAQFLKGGTSSDKTRIDILLASLSSDMKSIASKEFKEGLKPDLALEGSAATNSRRDTWSKTYDHIYDTAHPTLSIALRFSMDLDEGGKSKARSAMDLDAESSRILSERQKYEAISQWRELLRRYHELNDKIQTADRLAQIQKEKYKKEQERYKNGRSTTFQVISFDQDAADAALMLLNLNIQQRKLEAQGYMFVNSEDEGILL